MPSTPVITSAPAVAGVLPHPLPCSPFSLSTQPILYCATLLCGSCVCVCVCSRHLLFKGTHLEPHFLNPAKSTVLEEVVFLLGSLLCGQCSASGVLSLACCEDHLCCNMIQEFRVSRKLSACENTPREPESRDLSFFKAWNCSWNVFSGSS